MGFRWIHISDLHFGFDNYTVAHMRAQFLDYIKSLNPIDYLFITGDLIDAPKYQGSDEELLTFVRQTQGILAIRNDNVFVVPGNHDIKRSQIRELVITQVYKGYNSTDGIIDNEMLEHLNASRNLYRSLYKKITERKIDDNHFVIGTNNCNIIHLNTAILSGLPQEEGSLIVGMQLLRDAIDHIDTSIPSIVLAHHGFNWLSKTEQYQLESFLKDKNVSLYLCGHNHYATSKIILSSRQDKELWECSCGTQMSGHVVDMSFFAGSYDDSENTWIIEAHKWSSKYASWMLDSDFSFPQCGALDGKCYYPVNKRYEYAKLPLLSRGKSHQSDKKPNNGPKVFVSYSWDSEKHKNKVSNLVDKLRRDNVNVIFDGDLKLGDRISDFIECSISNSDFVLLLCSPSYKEKADTRASGVGYENAIISREVYQSFNERKFIPILLSGTWTESIPRWAVGKLGVDLSDSQNDDSEYLKLLEAFKLETHSIIDHTIVTQTDSSNESQLPSIIHTNDITRESNKRYKIAFSFPGEHRNDVKSVVDLLLNKFSKVEILYDEFHAAEFARPNLDIYLQRLYHDESELIVVVISKEYESKNWCGLEWRAIRDLINKRQENIMFLKAGDGTVAGFYDSVDGYIDITEQGVIKTAELITQKYNFISQSALFQQSSRHLDPVEVTKITAALAPNLIPCSPGEADIRMKDENGNELCFAYVKNKTDLS